MSSHLAAGTRDPGASSRCRCSQRWSDLSRGQLASAFQTPSRSARFPVLAVQPSLELDGRPTFRFPRRGRGAMLVEGRRGRAAPFGARQLRLGRWPDQV
jgi:hypothetical protein